MGNKAFAASTGSSADAANRTPPQGVSREEQPSLFTAYFTKRDEQIHARMARTIVQEYQRVNKNFIIYYRRFTRSPRKEERLWSDGSHHGIMGRSFLPRHDRRSSGHARDTDLTPSGQCLGEHARVRFDLTAPVAYAIVPLTLQPAK
jgi:hypothetical protein